jgi:leucyl aminopeptidase
MTAAKAPAAKQKADVLVVGAFADGTLPPSSAEVDSASKGRLSALLERGDLDEKPGSSLLLYDLPGTAAQRVLVVSLGRREEFGDKAFRKALAGAAKALGAGKAVDAAVTLAAIDVPGHSAAWRMREASRLLADGFYEFDAPKANGDKQRKRRERNLTLLTAEDLTPEIESAVRQGEAIAAGMALTRDLGNLPGNVCTPAYLADTARALGDELGFEVEVLERDDMQKLGMFAALSVGHASANPCKFIVMRYEGGAEGAKPIVLVGKGVTFDTGGISLKPGEDLDMMKYDMCGAASVFGAMKIAASLELPVNLIGIVNAVENMPGGDATRPGDVVTSMSGQTIEILNTDAEGRLGLCDALTYAERFEPECVVDVATLTGACVIALGTVASGLYANDDALATEMIECGTETGDRVWRMPLWDEYQEQLKSNFADMSNLGGRPAGSVTAACFLARFTKSYRWAHLDIAGTNATSGEAKGATGRPVPLLSEFLLRHSEAGRTAAAGRTAGRQPRAPH